MHDGKTGSAPAATLRTMVEDWAMLLQYARRFKGVYLADTILCTLAKVKPGYENAFGKG